MQQTLNDEWASAHPVPPKSVIRTMRMIARHGPGPDGAKCKTCAHLIYHEANKRYYKCLLYGDTASMATDWRCRQDACGQYQEREEN